MPSSPDNSITVSNAEPISPHNQALLEAGRKLLVDSIDVGRDACKFMVTSSLAAIPVYIGLLGLLLPDSYDPSFWTGFILLLPAFAFLVAAVAAAYGYLPHRMHDFSVDLIDLIEEARKEIMNHRLVWSGLAVLFFGIAVLLAVVISVWAIDLVPQATETKPSG